MKPRMSLCLCMCLCLGCLLPAGCASHPPRVRCERHLQPINVPLPGRAPATVPEPPAPPAPVTRPPVAPPLDSPAEEASPAGRSSLDGRSHGVSPAQRLPPGGQP